MNVLDRCLFSLALLLTIVGSIALFLVTFVFAFVVGISARAAELIRIAYSSVNPHALLAWIAEKRGLYA